MSTLPAGDSLLSPTLTATSTTSSFDLINDNEPRSRSSTISDWANDNSDDEIVWNVSPSHSRSQTHTSTSSNISSISVEESDDDFVVLNRPTIPVHSRTQSLTDPSRLTSDLGKLSLLDDRDGSATPSCIPSAIKSSINRNQPPTASQVVQDDNSGTPDSSESDIDSRSTSPSITGQLSKSKSTQRRNRRKKAKSLRKAARPSGLAARGLVVEDLSDTSSDSDDEDETEVYEQAVQFVNSFLTDPDAYNNSSGRLTLLQSIIIELGLASSSVLPSTLRSAKTMLKSHAFVNIREYLATRGQGLEAVQQIMHPSRSALVRSIRKSSKQRVKLDWVKEHGLGVLLVSCYH